MTYYVFKNYGYVSESCLIETPLRADANEVFISELPYLKEGEVLEIGFFTDCGEYVYFAQERA